MRTRFFVRLPARRCGKIGQVRSWCAESAADFNKLPEREELARRRLARFADAAPDA